MSIQKKSLLSGLNATKKAIVASSTTTSQASPTVSARIQPKVLGNAHARMAVRNRVASRVASHTKG